MPCSREEVLTIFQSADKDGSGMLSIKEFKKSNKGRFIMSKSLFLIFIFLSKILYVRFCAQQQ